MEQRPLTFAAAQSWPDDDEHCPTPRINGAGARAVDEFVAAHHATPQNVSLDAFYADAEQEACNLLAGYDGSIEIGTIHSRTGNPVTLRLSPEIFDWSVTVEE